MRGGIWKSLRAVGAAGAIVWLAACGGGDRLTLRFVDDSARAETAAIDVYAVGLNTRSGTTIDCGRLLDGTSSIDDGDTVVAQHTEVAVPVPASPKPLLVDLPQERYVFFAEARDRFGFDVARGCTEGTVAAQGALDLEVALLTLPAPRGRLDAAGATSWVQFAGATGSAAATPLAVYAFDDDGNPLPGVEVRALVEVGTALPLEPAFSTRLTEVSMGGMRGRVAEGHTAAVVGEGRNRILLHARGLQNSPIAFEITGVAGPEYTAESSPVLSDQGVPYAPIALVAGNFDVDTDTADEFLAVVDDGQVGKYCVVTTGQWCSVLDVAELKSQQCDSGDGGCVCNQPSRVYRPLFAVAGKFDEDEATDIAVVTAETPPRLLIHHNTNEVLDTTVLNSAIPQHQYPGTSCTYCSCPHLPDSATIEHFDRLVPARIDDDGIDDLLVEVHIAGPGVTNPHRIYICVSNGNAWCLTMRGTVIVPEDDSQLSLDGLDLAAGDLDGEGHSDLLLAPWDGATLVIPWRPYDPNLGWYHLPVTGMLAAVDGRKFFGFGDTAADPAVDLLAVSAGYLVPPTLQVVVGNGRIEELTTVAWVDLPVGQVDAALFDDFNGDGWLDALAISNRSPQTALLLGSAGDGTFSQPIAIGLGLTVVTAAAADINSDGVPEIGFLGRTSDGTELLLERSTGLAR